VGSTLFLSSNICHHGSGGASVDSAPSQEDPYISPRKDLKSIACLVQKLYFFKLVVANCDKVSSSSSTVVIGSDKNMNKGTFL
jgi:hypothetical protein